MLSTLYGRLASPRPGLSRNRLRPKLVALVTVAAAVTWAVAFGLRTIGPAVASSSYPVAVPDQWSATTQVVDNGDGTSTADI
jgi:hypothetical protein